MNESKERIYTDDLKQRAYEIWAANEDVGIPQSLLINAVVMEKIKLQRQNFEDLKKSPRWAKYAADIPAYLFDDNEAHKDKRATFVLEAMLTECEKSLTPIMGGALYDQLTDKTVHQSAMTTLQQELGKARKTAIAALENHKNIADEGEVPLAQSRESIVFFYKAAEKKLLDAEVARRTQDNPAFLFVEDDLYHEILLETLKPLSEGQEAYTRLMNTIDQVARETGHYELRRPHGGVVGKKEIAKALNNKLSKTGVGRNTLDALDIEHYVNDRLHYVDDQSLSLEPREIRAIAETFAPMLKNPQGKPIQIADEIVKDIAARAKYDRKPAVNADIESRYGKKPEDRHDTKTSSKDGLLIAGIGLGISTLSGLLGASAKLDATPTIPRPDETAEDVAKREKKAKTRSMTKLVFASVTSVIGTAILFDGLMFGGKYTMQAWNRMRGKGGPSGSAPSF